jgi:hypothetical protein
VIVRCLEEKPGIVVGREFVVLEITVAPSAAAPVMFMIHLPDEPITDWAYCDATWFDVVDNSLPSNWVFAFRERGFSLQPGSWLRPYFWDHLLNEASPDERRQSWDDYRNERDLILTAAGRPPGDRGSIVVREMQRSIDAL